MKKKIDLNSPLGQLLLEKRELKRSCREVENRLRSDWNDTRDYASYSLAQHPLLAFGWQMARPWLVRRLLSSLASLFRPSRQRGK